HVHCLVTGGGLTPAGQWVTVRNGFLLPVRVVMAVFRGKMLAALRRAFDRDELVLPEAMRPQQFLNLLNRLGHAQKTPWNVHIRERYRHGAGVVTYLGFSAHPDEYVVHNIFGALDKNSLLYLLYAPLLRHATHCCI